MVVSDVVRRVGCSNARQASASCRQIVRLPRVVVGPVDFEGGFQLDTVIVAASGARRTPAADDFVQDPWPPVGALVDLPPERTRGRLGVMTVVFVSVAVAKVGTRAANGSRNSIVGRS